MKNSEFKKEVDKLVLLVENNGSKIGIKLAQRLRSELIELDDESEVTPKIMKGVFSVLDEFWHWVESNLDSNQWQEGVEVKPWLNFQANLYHAGLMSAHYHHPMLYRQLALRYEQAGDGELELAKLMALLIPCARVNGYAGLDELKEYPFKRVTESFLQMKQLNLHHQISRQKNNLTQIATIFYLIHHYCTIKQLALLPQLIYFRVPTTDEERRSEQAIIYCLFNQPLDWQIFFAKNKPFIDSRERQLNTNLKEISHLLPKSHSEFIRALDEKRWIYSFIAQSRQSIPLEEKALIKFTIQLFQTDFSTQKNHAYQDALNFSSLVRSKTSSLTPAELKIVHSALQVFCLIKYEKDRREDTRPDSIFSFSGQTKCNAALKKQEILLGLNSKFSFFEAMALKQGRLKKLNDMFEVGTKAAL